MKKSSKKIITLFFALLMPVTAVLAQTNDVKGLLSSTSQTINSVGQDIINVVSGLIGVVGAIMLVWNFLKRAKGDQQSNDAIMNWGSALLFTALALQIIKAVYFRGA